MQRQRRKLTVEERVAIDLRRKDGWGVRAIARELGRSPSVISTEIGRGREQDGNYAAGSAQTAAAARRGAPGQARTGRPSICRGGEAPAPAARADRRETQASGGGNGTVVRTTSEAIYQAVYAVPRGELRRELLACLRQGKPQRGRRSKDGERRGRICDIIRERPAEVEGARTLGGRSDQGGRQPFLGRHACRAHQPQAGPGQAGQSRDGTRWLRRRLAGGAGTAAPHPDLRQG